MGMTGSENMEMFGNAVWTPHFTGLLKMLYKPNWKYDQMFSNFFFNPVVSKLLQGVGNQVTVYFPGLRGRGGGQQQRCKDRSTATAKGHFRLFGWG